MGTSQVPPSGRWPSITSAWLARSQLHSTPQDRAAYRRTAGTASDSETELNAAAALTSRRGGVGTRAGASRRAIGALRPIEWAQLGRRVPSGAIGANIRDVLRVHAPEVEYAEPAERQLRARRIELTIAGECSANASPISALQPCRCASSPSAQTSRPSTGLASSPPTRR